MRTRNGILCVLAALALGWASPARAATVSFGCITSNIIADCAIGAAQVQVSVDDPGNGQVLFTFTNVGSEDSSITDVYFDDGSLLALALVINSAGVSFSQDATPPDLPGGNNANPDFDVTAGFLADSDPPAQPNGVNPGEQLGILFDLQFGRVFQDVLDDLDSGALRIGIHVQGYESGGSESFVNAPEPASFSLLALACAALVAARRR